ncbi:MAG: GNAT family N-acetyltransferase [Candidatus Izemoplasma sp.]|nr:GNAT family N-acetyltransferase [Candidatus Izemoplasma sp.]
MHHFKDYTHSKAIIASHLNNMYPHQLIDIETYQILFTSVDFHFVCGIPPKDSTVFKQHLSSYIHTQNVSELIFFEDNKKWQSFLTSLFKKINGVIDTRIEYQLNKEQFLHLLNRHHFKHKIILDYITEHGSTKKFPIAKVVKNGKTVSYCKGFLMGNGYVELDVFTDDIYRRQEMAYESCLTLMHYLLRHNLTPSWSAWKAKASSHQLAKRLGFHNPTEMPAYIWIKDFGMF